MIELPNYLTDSVFDQKFKKGAVIHTRVKFSKDNEKYKYLIVLNKDCSQDPAIVFLTTTQIDFYNRNPQFNRDIIRINAGVHNFFPLETIINCRETYKISREKLKINYQKNLLEFVGVLPSNLMQIIDSIVTQSFFISGIDKAAIL